MIPCKPPLSFHIGSIIWISSKTTCTDKMVSSLNSITTGFSLSGSHIQYFCVWTLWLLCFFFAASFCAATVQGWLLFEGSVYFFGKPADINDDWIRYMGAIHWQLLDAISSICTASQSCCQLSKQVIQHYQFLASFPGPARSSLAVRNSHRV